MHKLSIITVNLNNAAGLQSTMDSVFAQTFTDYEYIVIDGGSSDGSEAIIATHADKLAFKVSEKDSGIFNAMNKGIANASGEYLLFLNSGDCLHDNFVLKEVFNKPLAEDIVYGNVVWKPAVPFHEGVFPDKLSFEYFTTYSLPHQASFTRKELFNIVGLYDEDQKIVSDWLFFFLAIYKFNCSYRHINRTVSTCDTTGLSLHADNWPKIVHAREVAIAKHFRAVAEDLKMLYSLQNELKLVKMTKGYRMHIMLRNFLNRYFSKTNRE